MGMLWETITFYTKLLARAFGWRSKKEEQDEIGEAQGLGLLPKLGEPPTGWIK